LAKTHKKKAKPKSALNQVYQKRRSNCDSHEVMTIVWKLAEPICSVEGMELIHVEYQRETGGRILRLYVDKPGGITLG
jgi:hypothetical protein